MAGYTQQMSNYRFALTAEEVADLILFLETYSPQPTSDLEASPHASTAAPAP